MTKTLVSSPLECDTVFAYSCWPVLARDETMAVGLSASGC